MSEARNQTVGYRVALPALLCAPWALSRAPVSLLNEGRPSHLPVRVTLLCLAARDCNVPSLGRNRTWKRVETTTRTTGLQATT